MEMTYNGALVMPKSYAVMTEDEMCYTEGGALSRVLYWGSIALSVQGATAAVMSASVSGFGFSLLGMLITIGTNPYTKRMTKQRQK